MSNRQDWVRGDKENLRKGCTGKTNAAPKGEGSDGEMSLGQAIPKLGVCSAIPASSRMEQPKHLPKGYFPVPRDLFQQARSIYWGVDLAVLR